MIGSITAVYADHIHIKCLFAADRFRFRIVRDSDKINNSKTDRSLRN